MSLIVGENLRQLNGSLNICPVDRYDVYSLKLCLSGTVFFPIVSNDNIIDYNSDDADSHYEQKELSNEGLLLNPNDCVLCCSSEYVKMPCGIFGLVQTKGSLARLFVSVQQTDAQIEPGFEGAITFEIKNNSPHRIRLKKNDNIAQLFLFLCTTDNAPAYNGRYSRKNYPTIKKSA